MKLRIFIDFWNFQLSVNKIAGESYKIDWTKISPWLSNEIRLLIDPSISFEETRIYLSFNPKSAKDLRMKDWANNTLDHFPGIHVVMMERKPKTPPTCPTCHATIDLCPKCGTTMAGTIEKGVDTAMVTDLLSLAWENAWEVAVLISSDRDFIPAVEMLSRKGYRVINGHFPPAGMELAKTCWASIDLTKSLAQIKR